jgi:hypothetical protein
MAKPEILRRRDVARPESRVIFETKESALFERAKRGGTRGIATLSHHNGTPLVLCASKRLGYDCFAYRNVARFLVGYADRQRLGSPVPTLVLFHCSLYLVTHRVNARN